MTEWRDFVQFRVYNSADASIDSFMKRSLNIHDGGETTDDDDEHLDTICPMYGMSTP
jgi:hypothetical protein